MQSLIKRLDIKSVDFITGLRRIGKTTLMKSLIQHLLETSACESRQILYVSVDDYGLSKKSILEIIDEFRRIQRLPFDRKIFLFLDEIAFQKDFEIQLKNLFDSSNVKLYLSSSSASARLILTNTFNSGIFRYPDATAICCRGILRIF
jgi:predicted AAA+ superfamily ATPase